MVISEGTFYGIHAMCALYTTMHAIFKQIPGISQNSMSLMSPKAESDKCFSCFKCHTRAVVNKVILKFDGRLDLPSLVDLVHSGLIWESLSRSPGFFSNSIVLSVINVIHHNLV